MQISLLWTKRNAIDVLIDKSTFRGPKTRLRFGSHHFSGVLKHQFLHQMFNVSVSLLDDALTYLPVPAAWERHFHRAWYVAPNSPDLNPVDDAVCGALQQMVINVDDSRQSTSWSRRSSLSGENCPSVSLIAPLVSGLASPDQVRTQAGAPSSSKADRGHVQHLM